ncbi:MAG: hypothetical protein ABJA81_01825 [Nocardioidaceae bacterium]
MEVHPAIAFFAGFLGLAPFLIGYLAGRGAESTPTSVTVGTNTSNPSCDQARRLRVPS